MQCDSIRQQGRQQVNAVLEELKDETVLYCEDEKDLQTITAGLLGHVVREVILADDGVEGLEQ
jgi:CheY-like chemotaxis protein